MENTSVPPLRPLTRSLTGRASKPRPRDDSWYQAPKKSTAGRKKPAAAGKSARKRTIDEVDNADTDKAESEEPQPRPPPPALVSEQQHQQQQQSSQPQPLVPPITQTTFVDSAPHYSALGLDTIRARARTNLPVPVPNLIKKSRGRRVPVVAALASPSSSTSAPAASPSGAAPSVSANGAGPGTATANADDANATPNLSKRLHICKVEGCGKCFHRGEHLKRHIRSIHTHEKRKCFFSLLSFFCLFSTVPCFLCLFLGAATGMAVVVCLFLVAMETSDPRKRNASFSFQVLSFPFSLFVSFVLFGSGRAFDSQRWG
jgi:hypothetical protein